MAHTKADLLGQLAKLGVMPGDVLYIRARGSAIGKVRPASMTSILEALLEALGPEGTLIVPSFTKVSLRWSRNKACFDANAIPNTGALSKAVLNYPGAIRSLHPTHSFVAIGKHADSILKDHDKSKSAFFPVGKLIEYDAKMLLVGCNPESPGFSTIHYVQHELGLTRRHWTRFLFEVDVLENGRKQPWRPSEDPGCSFGFDKMYRHYMKKNALITGFFGSAYTIMVSARIAYEADKAAITSDPTSVLCDRPDCITCKALNLYNIRAMPQAWARIGWKTLTKGSLK